MNTQDKATPRPWRINHSAAYRRGGIGFTIVGPFHRGAGVEVTTYAKASVDDVKKLSEALVRAVNEYEALSAIAEAANNLLGEIAWRFERTSADTNEELALQKIESALSALATLREGKE